ncbi:MAG TPA: PA14 domain-containing protein [Candidatus Paceibacterota bacterium]|nr:PA14 domain-containing protein [Candidatus Paceibacterota bacterium]
MKSSLFIVSLWLSWSLPFVTFADSPSKHLIMTSPVPTIGGTVSAGGTFDSGSEITVEATTNGGFEFVKWTVGEEEVSRSARYTFRATRDQMLIAHFTLAGAGGIKVQPIDRTTGPNWRTAAANDFDGDNKYGTDGYYIIGGLQRALRPDYVKDFDPGVLDWLDCSVELQDPSSGLLQAFHPAFRMNGLSLLMTRGIARPFRLTLIMGSCQPDDDQIIIIDAGSAGRIQTEYTGSSQGGMGYISFDIKAGSDPIQITLDDSQFQPHLSGLAFDHLDVPPVFYQVNVSASPIEAGVVTGGGNYESGTITNVSAVPKEGYRFERWTDHGTEVSRIATYSFTVTTNRELIAWFVEWDAEMPGLRRQIYSNIPGASIDNLIASSKYPDAPDLEDSVTDLESQHLPGNAGESYGQRLTGWLVPPVTGTYLFYLAADDAAQVFLSTDHSPYHKQLMVQETTPIPYRSWRGTDQHPARVSAGIPLVAYKRYYLEVLHKEDAGNDNVALAWQLPGGTAPQNGDAPIGSGYLVHLKHMPEMIWSVQPPGSGTVSLNPPPSDGGQYTNGTTVVLTAVPAEHFQFIGWSGGMSGTLNPATLPVQSDSRVTAHFALKLNDVTKPGDQIAATSANSPVGEGVSAAIDNNVRLKYVNLDKFLAGFTVIPSVGRTVVTGLGFTSAIDYPERDPASFRLYGTQDGVVLRLITEGKLPRFTRRLEQQIVFFENTTPYAGYQLIFPTVADVIADGVQIAEVQFFGVLDPSLPPRITASHQGGLLTLSWDLVSPDYGLEFTHDLIPPLQWNPVPGVVNNGVTISTQTGTFFYRLHK